MKKHSYKYLFELLQVAIGRLEAMSGSPTPEEWEEIFTATKEHALTGIAFKGVERLPKEQLPPPRRLRRWAVNADRIAEQNERITLECRKLCQWFRAKGFRACVLKGQANISYYEALGQFRSYGDIDVWVVPDTVSTEKGRGKFVRQVIELCLQTRKGSFVYYHNLDFPILKKTPVEVHYRPTWLFNPLRNRHLQQKLNEYRGFEGFPEWEGFTIPSVEFNVFYNLLHIYKHIFEEGIGLRQLLDYYFVLKKYHADGQPMAKELPLMLRQFGVGKFAAAVMYVLREAFGMPEEYMICPANEKEGSVLLNEIMQGGNFGKYDERYDWQSTSCDVEDMRGRKYAWLKLRHNFHLLSNYPEEVLCEPFFRIYHLLWRRLKLWRWE